MTVLPTLRFGSSLVDRYAGYAEIDFWPSPIASGASQRRASALELAEVAVLRNLVHKPRYYALRNETQDLASLCELGLTPDCGI